MIVQEDIPLKKYTTFRMGPVARYFIEIEKEEEIPEAVLFAKGKNMDFYVLGGGSNTIYTKDDFLDACIIKINIPGIVITHESDGEAVLRIGAGEEWDSVVAFSVERGFSGIEAMSAIPGSAGGTPIQNVGAYGQEIKDTLYAVDVYDLEEKNFKTLSNSECEFAYRDSIFKKKKRYIVLSIILKLSKKAPKVPEYPGVKAYFEKKRIEAPSMLEIREAIIEIRKNKLPDPKEIASVGSFFKNPIVSKEIAEKLKQEFEKPVIFEVGEGRYKIGAGWLIDTLGLKGKNFGNLSLYEHNALVIVNNGSATYHELFELVEEIQKKVEERFGIDIEPEPIFI